MFFSPISILPAISLSALLTMTIQRKHLLMALLALETMILTTILMIPVSLTKMNSTDTPMILIMLTFGACEACIGLACLVNLMRHKGNDMLSSAVSNKC